MARTIRNSPSVEYVNPTGQRAVERRQARATIRNAMQRGDYQALVIR